MKVVRWRGPGSLAPVRQSATLLAIAVVAASAAPIAGAQEPRVPDPDSPAGFEYELPLDQVRRDATGDDRVRRERGPSTPGSSTGAPLFGEGVSNGSASDPARGADGEAGAADGEPGAERPGSSEGRRAADRGGGRGETRTSESGAATPERIRASAQSEGSSTLTLVGLVLAVLLTGALLGLMVRLLLGRRSASR